MCEDKLEITFICENIKEFEDLLEKTFDLMSKNKMPRLAYKFNSKGKIQYDLSFPSIK